MQEVGRHQHKQRLPCSSRIPSGAAQDSAATDLAGLPHAGSSCRLRHRRRTRPLSRLHHLTSRLAHPLHRTTSSCMIAPYEGLHTKQHVVSDVIESHCFYCAMQCTRRAARTRAPLTVGCCAFLTEMAPLSCCNSHLPDASPESRPSRGLKPSGSGSTGGGELPPALPPVAQKLLWFGIWVFRFEHTGTLLLVLEQIGDFRPQDNIIAYPVQGSQVEHATQAAPSGGPLPLSGRS